VQVRARGGAHDVLEVAPRRRLAAREPDVHHAEGARLGEGATPGLGVEGVGWDARSVGFEQ